MPLNTPLATGQRHHPARPKTHTRHLRRLLPALALVALVQPFEAMAQNSGCWWDGIPGGTLGYQRTVGTLYIPRDAPIGSVIGNTPNEQLTWADESTRQVHCFARSTEPPVLYSGTASVPIYSGTLPPINGVDVNGKVLQTNIPGVGVVIRRGAPYTGTSNNSFTPVDGNPTVPFDAVANYNVVVRTQASIMRTTVTLIKIGQIPLGPQVFDGSELFADAITNLGKVHSYRMSGTVIQTHCTLNGNPVSADPVQLGEWDTTEFTGVGHTTTAVPFSIKLSNCEADTSGGLVTTAHIRLEGKNGSTPLDPTLGTFSLTSDSTAQGVGIQLLKADGSTPMELSAEVPLVAISPGDQSLNFNARFYQTGTTAKAGSAKGSLDFTMTYK